MEHPIVLGKLRERLANRSMNMTLWWLFISWRD
jgi:hypothetical protein